MSKQNLRMKPRKAGIRKTVKDFYIFTEGTETEPNYFLEIKRVIDHVAIYKDRVNIVKPIGTGLNTVGVVAYARDYLKKNQKVNGIVWCVYDKDEFPVNDFNRASKLTKELTSKQLSYHAAWSNQSFEYWFLLHFQYQQTDINRKQYIEKLSQILKNQKCGEYGKNRNDMFSILTRIGNPKQAIKWAKVRLKDYDEKTITERPSQIQPPATTVYQLIEELAEYFPDAIKEKYI